LDFLPDGHTSFLETLGDYFVMDNFLFTHAAYDASQPFNLQPIEMLRWHSLRSGIPDPHYSGLTAVVGHTANHEGNILDVGHLICLDTYCYGGGWLTAMDLPTRQVWQVNQAGQLRR
jgi:serine/threonine protein phosphatase 1